MHHGQHQAAATSRPWPWLAAAVAVFYAAVAIAVHHAGPFYVFDMYAFPAQTTTSRLTLVTATGAVVDVRTVHAIRCPADVVGQLATGTCAGIATIDARDDEVWDILQTRALPAGAAAPELRLVRRAFTWGDGPVRVRDCASVTCAVVVDPQEAP